MRITVSARKAFEAAGDCWVCLSEAGKTISAPGAKAAESALAEYARAVKSGRMTRMDLAAVTVGGKVRPLLFAAVGEGGRKRLLRGEQARAAASEAAKFCKKGGQRRLVFLLNGSDGAAAAPWVAEGLVLGAAYAFTKYKKPSDRPAAELSAELIVAPEQLGAVRAAVKQSVAECECANLARDLINEQGSVAVPAFIEQAASDVAKETGMECEIWDERRLKEEGYTGLLTVGQGAVAPPRMVVLRYRPADAPAGKSLCLVGKGITFDTGGISLKPPTKMWEMIGDMCGAAAVIGAMKAVALSRPQLNVTGILACAQNAVGSRAVLPGDIFVAKNGKSVHVENTDAEGRLVLADAFARAGEEKATHMVDVATLTGACERALGDSLTGLFANDRRLADQLRAIGEETGEEMWQLPLYAPYRDEIDHYRTDLNNVGKGPNAGAITAALFLQEFVPAGVSWAHLDIAGTSFDPKGYRYYGAGGRGVMVRTLTALARKLAGE